METKENGITKTLGTIDLAKFIKGIILNKPNKSQSYRSLATNLGDDFIPFVEGCTKQLKWAREKRIQKLEEEIKKLKEEQLIEPIKKKK